MFYLFKIANKSVCSFTQDDPLLLKMKDKWSVSMKKWVNNQIDRYGNVGAEPIEEPEQEIDDDI